jgi:hypothetical protein
LVAVAPGDFLGIFPGRLRYTDQKPARAIAGPVLNLWLDYLETIRKLNKIEVAKAGEMTNVCLAWEGVNKYIHTQFIMPAAELKGQLLIAVNLCW